MVACKQLLMPPANTIDSPHVMNECQVLHHESHDFHVDRLTWGVLCLITNPPPIVRLSQMMQARWLIMGFQHLGNYLLLLLKTWVLFYIPHCYCTFWGDLPVWLMVMSFFSLHFHGAKCRGSVIERLANPENDKK